VRTFNKNKFNLKLVGLFGFIVAIALTNFRGIQNTGADDAKSYVAQANEILNGWSYIKSNPGVLSHGTGFVLLIALTFFIMGSSSLFTFKIILAIGHGVSTFLVASIGQKLGISKRYYILAALLFAIDPFILYAATDIQTESLTTLFVLYWGYLYVSDSNNRLTLIHLCLFSLTGIVHIMIRPNAILPFLVIAVFMYYKWFHDFVKKFMIVLSGLLFILLLTIYEIFLTNVYSGFVFLSPIGGASAPLMCRDEFIPQYLGFASKEENARINDWVTIDNPLSTPVNAKPGMTLSEVSHLQWQQGIADCLSQPIKSIGVLLIKTFALWRPFVVYGAYDVKIFMFSLILWLPLTIFAIKFLFTKKLDTQSNNLRVYFILLSASFTLSLLLTPTQIRHRPAFAEPFYWIFALVYVENLNARYRRRDSVRSNSQRFRFPISRKKRS
jgi:hypothetical protein